MTILTTSSRLVRQLLLLAAVSLVASLSGSATTAFASIPTEYHGDTGWQSYDGGCQARTQWIYYSAANKITMKTDVHDPYLFVACRVNAHAIFDSGAGPINDGPTQYNYACAVWDPTCASTRYGPWEDWNPASVSLANMKDLYKAITGKDLDLATVVTGIRIQFSQAPKPGAAVKTAGARLATPTQIAAKAAKN